MTAETSNARRDGRPGIDRLWDSQWVNIVNSPEVLEAVGFRDCEEAVNIAVRMTEQEMAKNFAAAPPPAAARGDVRGLVALAKRVQYADTHAQVSKDDAGEFVCLPPWLWLEIRDAAAEALAAEGVQAGEVEQLAREFDLAVLDDAAETLDRIGEGSAGLREARARIASALSQQPEAQGVVDEEVTFNAAFFVSRSGNRIEQMTTYDDYRRDGALLALMALGQKRASARGLTKKNAGKVTLAWVTAPQVVECDAALTGERNG